MSRNGVEDTFYQEDSCKIYELTRKQNTTVCCFVRILQSI